MRLLLPFLIVYICVFPLAAEEVGGTLSAGYSLSQGDLYGDWISLYSSTLNVHYKDIQFSRVSLYSGLQYSAVQDSLYKQPNIKRWNLNTVYADYKYEEWTIKGGRKALGGAGVLDGGEAMWESSSNTKLGCFGGKAAGIVNEFRYLAFGGSASVSKGRLSTGFGYLGQHYDAKLQKSIIDSRIGLKIIEEKVDASIAGKFDSTIGEITEWSPGIGLLIMENVKIGLDMKYRDQDNWVHTNTILYSYVPNIEYNVKATIVASKKNSALLAYTRKSFESVLLDNELVGEHFASTSISFREFYREKHWELTVGGAYLHYSGDGLTIVPLLDSLPIGEVFGTAALYAKGYSLSLSPSVYISRERKPDVRFSVQASYGFSLI